MMNVLALLALGLAVALRASVPSGSIDDFITSEMPASGTPGLAYAIVKDGGIHSDSRGEMLIGSGRKVTSDTPFQLGSVSKSFTAMAVMQLVEADKVDLDAGISQYLEVFSGSPGHAITIRQMLSHTSGYSTLQGNQIYEDLTTGRDELARQVEQVAKWAPAYEPGTRWAYSNANYQILGVLIEALSGLDYASYIETRILKPIGMNDSFVADGENHDTMARGHRPWFGTKRPMKDSKTHRVYAPAGGVIASANDVARYLSIMMNGEDDVISATSKAAMLRPASDASPFYGFGWLIDAQKGTVYHSGESPGTETLAVLAPAKKKAVVVLVNAGGGIGFGETRQLRNGIAARALGLDYSGEGSRWQQKALFIALVLLPLVFLLSMIWAWLHRVELRAKSGAFGLFSLWFPLFMTLGMAWIFFYLVPKLFGLSMGTLRFFWPDLGLTFVVSAATGVMWAVFRLGMAYSGKSVSS
jgi:CubicO group peptidase (beta-lactamase class C family)